MLHLLVSPRTQTAMGPKPNSGLIKTVEETMYVATVEVGVLSEGPIGQWLFDSRHLRLSESEYTQYCARWQLGTH